MIGMTMEESINHKETVLSDCTEGEAKCCNGYKNCLDLCDAQTDRCVSFDKYAAFYVNIKIELGAEKAHFEACKDMRKVASAEKDDEAKSAALKAAVEAIGC